MLQGFYDGYHLLNLIARASGSLSGFGSA